MSFENLKHPFAAALSVALLSAMPGCRQAPAAEDRAGPSETSQAAQAISPSAPSRAASGGYPFTPAEAAAVDGFLRTNPSLRVATDADRKPGADGDAELKSLYGIYHAYFVRGDLNDDGVLDFVLGFVRRDLGRGTPWFSVVVFTGRSGTGSAAGFSSGIFLERDVTLTRGDISVDRDSIVINPDLEEEAVRRYRWDPRAHAFVFVREDTDDPERPSVSQTGNRDVRRARAPRA
ncbi:MAG: hypothetical protein M3R62_15090 [Acidobacteriota bacterium]|nr:hypothetical protein [Acidobacteriota bacterium]